MFKDYFKKYKSKNADLSDIYNLKGGNPQTNQKFIQIHSNKMSAGFFGLLPPNQWDIYEINEAPGLIFIKNPFTALGQRYWIAKSLRDYSRKPNKTNLDIFNCLAENENWWEICELNNNNELLKKMRWVTLGYHHNWDTKEYSENSKNFFPADLKCLTEYIARVLGYNNYKAEAAIVNFYHMNSTLSGHTDHSENDLEAPLVSISFGQTAVFLLGGKTLDEKPIGIFLHSGDIIIMSKESRLCYHGVPKIIPAFDEPWNVVVNHCDNSNCVECLDESIIYNCKNHKFWKPFETYIKNSRININVRQVLKHGQTALSS